MTSYPTNLLCKVVKKKRDDLKWSEVAFEDAETGERCKPKVIIPELLHSEEHTVTSSRAPLHSEMSYTDDEVSILSMDDESLSSSIRRETNRPRSRLDEKPARRGSLGRFADRIGKRLGNDLHDDHTVSTSASSFYTEEPTDDGDSSPTSVLPTDIRAPTQNRLSFLPKAKQRTTLAQKYVGFKEFTKRQQQSEERRGMILSSLYTCMDEGDDEEDDILANILGSNNVVPNTPANRAA